MGAEGKSLVFGIYQRNGKKHDTLIPLIKQHTKKSSLYYTDDHTAYASLDLIGKHQIIAHRMEEYVREDTSHINGIEGFWSYAKTWLYSSRFQGNPKKSKTTFNLLGHCLLVSGAFNAYRNCDNGLIVCSVVDICLMN